MSYIYHFCRWRSVLKRTDSDSYAAVLYNIIHNYSLPLTPLYFVLKKTCTFKPVKDQLIVLAFFFVPVFCIPDGKYREGWDLSAGLPHAKLECSYISQ